MEQLKDLEQVDLLLLNTQFATGLLVEPIGICYLTSYVRSGGFSVGIYDPAYFGGELKEHLERLLRLKFKVLGISVLATEYRTHVFWLIRQLREKGFDGHICVGGQDVSLNYEYYLNEYPDISSAAIGEGEETLLELMLALKNKSSLSEIKGLAYRNDSNEIIFNGKRALQENIDSLPFMARDILKLQIELLGSGATASLITTRGCSHYCKFCSIMSYYSKQDGKHFRCRSVDNILEEMVSVNKEYGITKFSLDDDNFMLPKDAGIKRIEEFYEKVQKLSFKPQITISVRIDGINKRAIELLKASGLYHMYIGVESFIDKDLELFGKGINCKQIKDALDLLFSLGFSTVPDSKLRMRIGTIIFNPYTTIEELKVQLSFFRKYKIPPKKLCTILIIYPHTMIYNQLHEEGLLNEDNSFIFKDQRVQSVYSNYKIFLKEILYIRDRIRSMEKIYHMQGESIKEALMELRTSMDIRCYDVFEEMLNRVEASEELLTAYKEAAVNTFNIDFASEDIIKRIEQTEKTINIAHIGSRLR